MLVYLASLAGLERLYKESAGLGSYTDQKAVVLSKNESDYSYQFYGSPFDKEEEEEAGKLEFLQISVCHYSMYYTSFECTVGYITIHRDGYVSKRLRTAAFGSFEPFCLYRANGRVSAIPTLESTDFMTHLEGL